LKTFQQELDLLSYEEVRVNQALIEARRMFEHMTENDEFEKLGYVTFEDIKSLTNGSEVNLIAIKAPPNTSLEFPDPEQIDSIHNEVRKVNKHLNIQYLINKRLKVKSRKLILTLHADFYVNFYNLYIEIFS